MGLYLTWSLLLFLTFFLALLEFWLKVGSIAAVLLTFPFYLYLVLVSARNAVGLCLVIYILNIKFPGMMVADFSWAIVAAVVAVVGSPSLVIVFFDLLKATNSARLAYPAEFFAEAKMRIVDQASNTAAIRAINKQRILSQLLAQQYGNTDECRRVLEDEHRFLMENMGGQLAKHHPDCEKGGDEWVTLVAEEIVKANPKRAKRMVRRPWQFWKSKDCRRR